MGIFHLDINGSDESLDEGGQLSEEEAVEVPSADEGQGGQEDDI